VFGAAGGSDRSVLEEMASHQLGADVSYDFLGKVVLLGDPEAGKRTILKELKAVAPGSTGTPARDGDDRWPGDLAMVQIDCGPAQRVLLQICIVNAEERRIVETSLYHGIDAALYLFDITQKGSLARIPEWIREVNYYEKSQRGGSRFGSFLIATKTDLRRTTPAAEQVSAQDVKDFLQAHSLEYYEISRDEPDSIWTCFRAVAQCIILKRENRPPTSSTSGSDLVPISTPRPSQKAQCCEVS
jgi:GTPase SAR1 family protein